MRLQAKKKQKKRELKQLNYESIIKEIVEKKASYKCRFKN